jgi:hypothetical protein
MITMNHIHIFSMKHIFIIFITCSQPPVPVASALGNIGLPQLIGVLRDFFARIGISKLRALGGMGSAQDPMG